MKIKLNKRDVVGRKAKNLRAKNLVPANVYGPSREPVNVSLTPKEFKNAFMEAGYNQLIDAEIEGESAGVKVLFKEVQMDPIKDLPIHISFYQVDMTKSITTTVPVEIQGFSPAVKNNIGLLISSFDALSVNCLPGAIPEKFVINVDTLANIGDSVHVYDLQLPEGVRWDSSVDDRAAVVYIAAPQKTIEEEEAETAAKTAASADAAPAEGAEGAAPADAAADAKKD
jgi:large subunit ribosomal protein L25